MTAKRSIRSIGAALVLVVFGIGVAMLRSSPSTTPPAQSRATQSESETDLETAAERALVEDPSTALDWIAEADRRFGVDDEARRKLEIEALVRLGRIGQAHAHSDRFYRAFPQSASIQRIARLTGYHPRPYGPEDR